MKRSIKRHIWYLKEQLVVLALFDPILSYDIKNEMATVLQATPRPDAFQPGKPVFPACRLEVLDTLVGPQSWLLFHLLEVNGDWLALPAGQWGGNPGYIQMASIVANIAVVNDAAERGVKHVQDYADDAMDDVNRGHIILVSNSHRVKLPDFLKNEMEENL